MNTWCVTFMQKQAFKNHYVRITAPTHAMMRQCMNEHFGDKFMTDYPAEGFNEQIERFGLRELCNVVVINHRCEEHPSLEYLLIPEGVNHDAMMYEGDD